MGVRDERLAAVQARVERVAATGDLSPVLEKGALAEARRLAKITGVDDLQALEMYSAGCIGTDTARCRKAGTAGTSTLRSACSRLASPKAPGICPSHCSLRSCGKQLRLPWPYSTKQLAPRTRS